MFILVQLLKLFNLENTMLLWIVLFYIVIIHILGVFVIVDSSMFNTKVLLTIWTCS